MLSEHLGEFELDILIILVLLIADSRIRLIFLSFNFFTNICCG